MITAAARTMMDALIVFINGVMSMWPNVESWAAVDSRRGPRNGPDRAKGGWRRGIVKPRLSHNTDSTNSGSIQTVFLE